MGVAERGLKQGAAGERDGLDDLPVSCQHWESTCVSTTTHSGGFAPDNRLLGPENQHPQPRASLWPIPAPETQAMLS